MLCFLLQINSTPDFFTFIVQGCPGLEAVSEYTLPQLRIHKQSFAFHPPTQAESAWKPKSLQQSVAGV